MQQKICFSKKLGFIIFIGFVFLFTAGTLNLLTKQKTSTNSRASEVMSPPSKQNVTTPTCNGYGDVIVRDEANVLWSWASVSTDYPTGNMCVSELYSEIPPANKKIIELPSDVDSSKYSESFTIDSKTRKCIKHGIKIYISENGFVPVIPGTYMSQVPSILVGQIQTDSEFCNTGAMTYPKCGIPYLKTIKLSNGTQECWKISYEQCKSDGLKKCCGNKQYLGECAATPIKKDAPLKKFMPM